VNDVITRFVGGFISSMIDMIFVYTSKALSVNYSLIEFCHDPSSPFLSLSDITVNSCETEKLGIQGIFVGRSMCLKIT
jgi:hypothetical protein